MEQADPSTRTPVLEISLLVCWMAAFHDKFHLVFLVVSFWSPLSRRLWSPFSRGLLFSSPSGLSIASPQPLQSLHRLQRCLQHTHCGDHHNGMQTTSRMIVEGAGSRNAKAAFYLFRSQTASKAVKISANNMHSPRINRSKS